MSDYRLNRREISRLVKKAQKGNRGAMETLLNKTSDYVYYYCLSLLQNEDKAADAVQDIDVILLEKLKTLESPDSFLGWLKVITANYCKNKINRLAKEQPIDEIHTELKDEDLSVNPEIKPENDELNTAVADAIHALPDLQRECILMRYYHEMSIAEMAQVLEVSEGTVKSRLYYARKEIKQKLEKAGFTKTALGAAAPLFTQAIHMDFKKQSLTAAAGGIKKAAGAAAIGRIGVSAVHTVAPIKIAAIATACTLVTGGAAIDLIARYGVQNTSISSTASDSTDNLRTDIQQTDTLSEESISEKLRQIGFTDDDRRKELFFDETEENLNCLNNKEYVFDRMNNTLDYFETLQGTLRYEYQGNQFFCVFYIDRVNDCYKELVYEYNDFKLYDGIEHFISPYLYTCRVGKKEISWHFTEEERMNYRYAFHPPYENTEDSPMYAIVKMSEKPLAQEMKAGASNENRMIDSVPDDLSDDITRYIASRARYKDTDGDGAVDEYHLRPDSVKLPHAHYTYYPYAVLQDYLEDFDSWDIVRNQTEKSTVWIQGTASGGKSYDAFVNKDTGILESFQSDDDPTGNEIPILSAEYTLNQPINQSVFDDLDAL